MDNQIFEEIMTAASDGVMTPALRARLDEVSDEVGKIDDELERLADRTKALGKSRQDIVTKLLPTVLHQCGLTAYTSASGQEVKLETICSGSLPKDEEKRAVAIALLKDYGAEGIIKTEVTASFGVGEYSRAEQALQILEEHQVQATLAENVHPQTLAAFARERMANNEPTDTEKLGLFVAQIAKVKKVKK